MKLLPTDAHRVCAPTVADYFIGRCPNLFAFLVECKLEDAAIIRQILEGTHNQANTFRMPAFTNKLTRAEMESLVPLVKAFRPVPPATSNSASNDVPSGNPRLVGILNLPAFEYAVFEKGGSRGRYFLLREKESHDGVTLLTLNLMRGTAKLEVGGANRVLNLALDDQVGLTKRTGISGFLKNLGEALTAPPEGVVLKGADVDLVLFLFSQFSGETLLPSPRLPHAGFDLKVVADGPGDAARKLRRALGPTAMNSSAWPDRSPIVSRSGWRDLV